MHAEGARGTAFDSMNSASSDLKILEEGKRAATSFSLRESSKRCLAARSWESSSEDDGCRLSLASGAVSRELACAGKAANC